MLGEIVRVLDRPHQLLPQDDILGHAEDVTVRNALKKVKEETIFLKILGSYPIGS
jgi:hypothetical protein